MPTAPTEWPLSDADFRLISELVYNHCGITLHDGKREMVQARLAKLVRDGGFRSIKAYVEKLQTDTTGAQFSGLIDAISTNLTSFFREAEHFHHLTNVIIPELVQTRRKDSSRSLMAWSAACSSGEEPYSMGITIAEALAAQEQVPGHARPTVDGTTGPAGWDVRILATDISTRVLATARAGLYPAERLSQVSPECRQTYFGKCDTRFIHGKRRATSQDSDVYQVRPFLRNMIRFRHMNLMEEWPFNGAFDVIFCRNVMIYFDKPTQERLINRFWHSLRPGGVLFTGHSESLTGVNHCFTYVKPSIYSRPQG